MKLKSGIGEKPLWSQLYEIIESKILSDIYKKGDILPSEKDLMQEYQVSRVTVRQAMDKLIAAGLIERSRGIGTTVIKNQSTIITSFQSSFHGVREQNNDKDRRIIKLEMVVPPKEVSSFFGIKSDMKTLKLVRMTYLDDRPVTYYETYLNPITKLDENTDFTNSMYHFLEEVGFKITSVKEKISAAIGDEEDILVFKKDISFAIMIRIRKGFSTNIPVEYTYSKYVAEGYDLEIDLF